MTHYRFIILILTYFTFHFNQASANIYACKSFYEEPIGSVAINKEKFDEDFRRIMSQMGEEKISRTKQSFLDWIGVDPGSHSEIVVVSFNNFLGDNIIFYVSMFESLRKKYPLSKIKFISPKANIVSEDNELAIENHVFPVRFLEFTDSAKSDEHLRNFVARMPGFLKANINKEAFVFFDLSTIEKAELQILKKEHEFPKKPSEEFFRVMTDLKATAIGLSNLSSQGRMLQDGTGFVMLAPHEKLNKHLTVNEAAEAIENNRGEVLGVHLIDQWDFSSETIYESRLRQLAFIFGADMKLSWRYSTLNDRSKNLNISYFLQQKGLDPSRGYALLNLNTFGNNKVQELGPKYFDLMSGIVKHVLENTTDNLLVTFPENQFGPEVQEKIIDLVFQSKNRIAFLTVGDREEIPSIIKKSRWVISYDSGLVHLSAFMPENQILTIGLSKADPQIWRKPSQPFIYLPENAATNDFVNSVNKWISSFYQKSAPSTSNSKVIESLKTHFKRIFGMFDR